MKPSYTSFHPMNSQTTPRQQLIEAISDLSDRQVILLLQWIETLQKTPPLPLNDPTTVDPLIEFVGSNTHGHLASSIDDTLYG